MEDGEIRNQEVYRFPNGVTEPDGYPIWDIEALTGYVKAGIDEAMKAFRQSESLSVDTDQHWNYLFRKQVFYRFWRIVRSG